jgi:hypothetical protein
MTARYAYTRLPSGEEGPPRPPACAFELLTAPLPADYEEIGVLKVYGRAAYQVEEFRLAVRETVCRVGGDAVLVSVDPGGALSSAIVLRRTPLPQTPASSSVIP